NFTGGLELLALRRRWPPRFTVIFDQIAALLAVNLALWAALDFLHSEPHAPLALDGLFGWACYLLLGLAAGALVARAESRDARTRALPVVLIYTCLLAVRVLGAAFGPVRVRAAVVAVVLVLASPWSIGMLNLDTRLWVVEEDEPAQTQEADEETEAEALFYEQPAQI